ncbi:hypothetical protein FRACYDRAFT_231943 [Fragilariopsis cylindrus CCMP1102]|uniref:Uncharacterized protein n=1 Tax=Fragilariopsis cylindrus CCMP1102 TaxID=635003 RepID=A0A1E7FUK5_9STRA|nr:hypothetical protein FRACYDRAFT_231943 [Fragilariopsis cylindrus CCMP1102]|eukprot:OEU21797.1 hypothetical protein FRACYDRAFT_231943 [Fragilariopsis cylindrus CCMP1102]
MDAFKKNLTSLGSKVKEQAEEVVTRYSLDEKATAAKAQLEIKAAEAQVAASKFAKDHELDVKAESAKKQADEFIKEKKLDVKAADAKKEVGGFMKEHKLDEKANSLILSAETALGLNKNKNSVYPEVIQELEFKLVDGKGSGKVSDSEATADVTTEEKKSFVSKYAPSLPNVQEGSIAYTLLKTKSKVFGGAAIGAGAAAGVAAGAASSEKDKTNDEETDAKFDEVMKEANESYSGSGNITMEELKNDANDISAEMEASADKITVKEEAQKALLPLMAKLVLAKNKFLSMASKNKDKKEIEGEGEKEEGTTTVTKEGDAAPSEEKGKLPSEYAMKDFKFRAEKAAKEAFENAERIAKDVATKVGIIKVAASEDTKEETEEEGIEVKLEEETTAPVPAVTDDEEAKVD